MTERDARQRADRHDGIVNPEDLPAQIEVTEHDGTTRVDIAEDAATRPGEPGDGDRS